MLNSLSGAMELENGLDFFSERVPVMIDFPDYGTIVWNKRFKEVSLSTSSVQATFLQDEGNYWYFRSVERKKILLHQALTIILTTILDLNRFSRQDESRCDGYQNDHYRLAKE